MIFTLQNGCSHWLPGEVWGRLPHWEVLNMLSDDNPSNSRPFLDSHWEDREKQGKHNLIARRRLGKINLCVIGATLETWGKKRGTLDVLVGYIQNNLKSRCRTCVLHGHHNKGQGRSQQCLV